MRYAIIAAGEGSRLAQEGLMVQKPFVKIHGETLMDRLVRIFRDDDAEDVVVALRSTSDLSNISANTQCSLRDTQLPTIVFCSTPSSMHSFYELKPYLDKGEPFVLTTVDTVFREDEFCDYVKAFQDAIAEGYDGLMGVTDYIDDEKPLYVKVKGMVPQASPEEDTIVSTDEIEGFYDEAVSPYVSAGVYGLCPNALETLERCVEKGESRMRNFQRALIREGKRLKAWRFSKVIDIDHVGDIKKAEEMIAPCPSFVYILRAEEFSPGRVEDDRAIMMAVKDRVGEGLVIREEDLTPVIPLSSPIPHITVFSMARRSESLEILKQWEMAGVRVVNPPDGVGLCRKNRWDALMRQHNMPVPPRKGHHGYWLKRGDMSVSADSGIAYCKDDKELEEVKRRFAERGVSDIVVHAHVRGDVVKFYGVLNDRKSECRFFRCYPSLAPSLLHSLSFMAERMARIVGVPIYGGDAVITSDNDFYIIDFNDWPSFSRCREESAEAIVRNFNNRNIINKI